MTAPLRILQDVFGFDAFRPGQEAAIGALLAGRHVLTVMPTGSGKSLCFQVPALVLDGLTVVVSPRPDAGSGRRARRPRPAPAHGLSGTRPRARA